ncbi:MAG: erythromycin esterase family protein [Bdellovibrionales bacterium]
MSLFKDRHQAGALLAEKLIDVNLGREVCVLALPRGGVPLGWEIAQKLNCPLDLVFVKKIGAPHHEELAIGAISEAGAEWRQDAIDYLEISSKKLKELARAKQKDLKIQLSKWRKGREPVDVKGKTVVVVDDGLATGATMVAALNFLRKKSPHRLIVAVPVASSTAAAAIAPVCDESVILQRPEPFFSVGQWYQDFTQVTDEGVKNLLEGFASEGVDETSVLIPFENLLLEGELIVPSQPKGLVIFAHGSGSTHKSPRNLKVAGALNKFGFATLLFDLLTPAEAANRSNVFNIPLLVERLRNATGWALEQEALKDLPIGYFGASTGAAAALGAAASEPLVKSVVSRGGRPDLAGEYLQHISSKVLLIVGGDDHGVIELNERAKAGLFSCEMVIIPGAGHLFEEGNTMAEVVEYATNWFAQTLTPSRAGLAVRPRKQIVEDIQQALHPLTEDGIAELAHSVSDARVVMLGEATHGTEEFYKIRRLISEKLIRDHGFKFIAVEGDWPDCYKLNRYIKTGNGEMARLIMAQFNRWPTWMWANEQTAELIEGLKGTGAGFYGLDVYSLYESIEVIKAHASKLKPDLRRKVLEAYSCFESFDRDEISYSRSLARMPKGCASEALDALRRILRLRLKDTELHAEELFDTKQNAKIIRNGEQYYRSVLQGDGQSWNIRDEHMMDTLMALLQKYDDGAKAIVWAHNTHIGDYHATDMREAGYVNLGGLARERLGPENVHLVGFGTYKGEVLAGRAWDARPESMKLPAASDGSYEGYFHRVAEQMSVSEFYLKLSDLPSLSVKKGHRAVGVVYQPIFEQHGKNYVPTELSKRYDHFVFIDKTHALKAFPRSREIGLLPETWPTGT